MKKTLLLMFCSISAVVMAQSPCDKGLNAIDLSTSKAVVRFLSNDLLKGREAGTEEVGIAAEFIACQLQMMGIQPLSSEGYFQPFKAYAKERQKLGRWEVYPDSIQKLKQTVHRELPLKNVLAVIPGKNSDRYVVVGAHYDHIGMDPLLHGDKIYNGADDNASGVSAVLQIAKAFLASGKQPERSVIFAFWDGEEKGLLGSSYFVLNNTLAINGYLNFDMIGRDDPSKYDVNYYFTAQHTQFGKWLKDDIVECGYKLLPKYIAWPNPVGGSDNSSFAKAGIPIVWYHTGGHKDYHLPTDHYEAINWDKLLKINKLSFLTAWHLANESNY